MSEGALWAPFCQGTNPTHEGSTLVTQSPPKDSTSNSFSLGVRISTYNLGDRNIQCVTVEQTATLKSGETGKSRDTSEILSGAEAARDINEQEVLNGDIEEFLEGEHELAKE